MEKEKIEHFSHPHPLVFNDETVKEACCWGCLESLMQGPSYKCDDGCEFHLHKRCAEAPLQITNSPFHSKCPSLILRGRQSLTCDLCKQDREMFYYRCSSCSGYIDIKCALLLHNIDDNFLELKYYAHPHLLTFIQNPTDELQNVVCYVCLKPVGIQALYACLDCRFYLHKICAQFPSQLDHHLHRKHILYPDINYYSCRSCKKGRWGLFYGCGSCNIYIDIECIHSKSKQNHHEHPMTELFRRHPFLCDACGTVGNHISYVCSVCHILVHKKCISLPRKIRTSWHHHLISHSYIFKKGEFETYECGICLGEVKTLFGAYHCLNKDCDYVVHVNCTLELGRYEEVYDDENDQYCSGDFAIGSCITCVIEKNENGEAWKIQHVSHEHELTHNDKIEEEDIHHKQCEGCLSFISTSYYYCSKCHFYPHKTCAELPKRIYHWYLNGETSLVYLAKYWCAQCDRLCSGFFYESNRGGDKCCVRCVRVSHTPICEAHKHKLVFDNDFDGRCNACGDRCYGRAFKCKECTNFALDRKCISLPPTTWHKFDTHLLKLAFGEKNDDPKQHYCDICEEKRDPNQWFYFCAICDNSIHPKCAMGRYPFLKKDIGSSTPYLIHRPGHDVIFVRNTYETCFECGKPCADVALQCLDSNSTVHLDCCYGYWSLH